MPDAVVPSLRRDPEAPAGAAPASLLLAISFAGGFFIMVLEICGLRVLATHLGSSVFVTGTLLTLYMVLLSAGYYTGGLLSGRWGRAPRVLFGLMLGAALYVLPPPMLKSLSVGELANVFGQALALPLLALLALRARRLHRQPALEYLGYRQGQFPEAERAAAEVLSLPLFPLMTEEQQDHVAAALFEAFGV